MARAIWAVALQVPGGPLSGLPGRPGLLTLETPNEGLFPPRVPPGSYRIANCAFAGRGAPPGRADPAAVSMETAGSGCARIAKGTEPWEIWGARVGGPSGRTCSYSPTLPSLVGITPGPKCKMKPSCGPAPTGW